MISDTRAANPSAKLRQKNEGKEDVSKAASKGFNKSGGSFSSSLGLVLDVDWLSARAGGLTLASKVSKATMFWQRAETSRSVRSNAVNVARARAIEAMEEVMQARRYDCKDERRS
jgi:hypothetical protein